MPKVNDYTATLAELNSIMRALGYRTTFAIKRGGWVAEYHAETGNMFFFRTPELQGKLDARRRQLQRMTAAEKVG